MKALLYGDWLCDKEAQVVENAKLAWFTSGGVVMLGFSEVMHFQKQVGVVGVEIGGCGRVEVLIN